MPHEQYGEALQTSTDILRAHMNVMTSLMAVVEFHNQHVKELEERIKRLEIRS